MTEPLSAEQLAELRKLHVRHRDLFGDTSICAECWAGEYEPVQWPCSTVLLLAELDRREAQDRWPGRNHVSPWPGR